MSRVIIIAVIGILSVINHDSYAQTKKNKEVVRFFMEEILGNGRHELYKDVHTTDFVVNTENGTATLEQDYQAALDNRKGLPDLSFKVIRLVAEKDFVVAHWRAWGTNTGTNSYLPKASGKRLEAVGITIFRMKDGKIAEEWGLTNLLEVLMKNDLLK